MIIVIIILAIFTIAYFYNLTEGDRKLNRKRKASERWAKKHPMGYPYWDKDFNPEDDPDWRIMHDK